VVLDSDQLECGTPSDLMVVSRAVSLAEQLDAKLELFHACDSSTVEQKLFDADDRNEKESQRLVDHFATRMSELALNISSDAPSVQYEVRRDSPEVDAILRRISEFEADVVMLRSSGREYVFGVFSNVEWELIRRSPIPVWFVNDEVESIKRIVAAIGTIAIDEDIISASDYEIAQVAETIAQAFGAETYPVHAFKVPPYITNPNAYTPILTTAEMPPVGQMDDAAAVSREIAEEHGKQISALLGLFKIDPERLRVAQGDPARVVPEAARQINAELVVMGARSLSRWQRFSKRVTAEPVLAGAPGDVIFAKNAEQHDAPELEQVPQSGSPTIDIEAAITDPPSVFGTPSDLADERTLSRELRLRILSAWDQDVRAQIRMLDEGGETMPIDADLLAAIRDAKWRIEAERNDSS